MPTRRTFGGLKAQAIINRARAVIICAEREGNCMDNPVLHTPVGIKFECTSCGNCCFNWPVPLTRQDVDRINSLAVGSSEHMRAITHVNDKKLSSYSYTLEKRADGCCVFLTDENLCRLHLEHG